MTHTPTRADLEAECVRCSLDYQYALEDYYHGVTSSRRVEAGVLGGERQNRRRAWENLMEADWPWPPQGGTCERCGEAIPPGGVMRAVTVNGVWRQLVMCERCTG